MDRPVLEIQDLKTYFHYRNGRILKAVDGVSLSVNAGEALGIVGESGCGKSLTCLSVLRLIPQPAGRIMGGKVLLHGENLLEKTEAEMRRLRGTKIAMILQDPMTSLNPVFDVGEQVSEPLRIHEGLRGRTLREKVINLLGRVRIPSPDLRMDEYPHQFSGGMRQRIVAAMALACQPDLLIADEPTTALDVTIQLQILKLLEDIRKNSRVAVILVTHDFGVVANTCDRIAVMYAGKVVEQGSVGEIFDDPRHPYTIGLMRSIPRLGQGIERLPTIEGQPPSLDHLIEGCRFAPRCFKSLEICRHQAPEETWLGENHSVACWVTNGVGLDHGVDVCRSSGPG